VDVTSEVGPHGVLLVSGWMDRRKEAIGPQERILLAGYTMKPFGNLILMTVILNTSLILKPK